MAMRLTTTDQEGSSHVGVLVHGGSGTGKTPLIATAPTPFIISAEGGLLSLATKVIPTAVISTLADLDEAYSFCAYSSYAKDFETICLDSVTEIADNCLAVEKSINKDPRKAYGNMYDEVMKRLRWFRDLPGKHIYFSAKQAWIKEEISGIMQFGPRMPGQQLGPALPYMFDEVFSLELAKAPDGTVWNYLRCQRDPMYMVRDRSGLLNQIEEPNLTKIFNKVLRKTA